MSVGSGSDGRYAVGIALGIGSVVKCTPMVGGITGLDMEPLLQFYIGDEGDKRTLLCLEPDKLVATIGNAAYRQTGGIGRKVVEQFLDIACNASTAVHTTYREIYLCHTGSGLPRFAINGYAEHHRLVAHRLAYPLAPRVVGRIELEVVTLTTKGIEAERFFTDRHDGISLTHGDELPQCCSPGLRHRSGGSRQSCIDCQCTTSA